MNSRRLAFIDIGTNTILCLIAELKSDGSFDVLDDLAEITRLGQGVHQTRTINPEGEERSFKVLERYLERCKGLNVEAIIAVGTSALRDARNSAAVRARFREQLGLDVRVISGDEEAAYSFLAVQQGLPLKQQELLVIDVGGGSTEFIRGNEAGVSQAVSINIGSVRLTEQFLHSDPVQEEECEKMMAAIEKALAQLPRSWLKDSSILTLIGIAGTCTTLAAVEKKLTNYSHGEVHGGLLTLDEVRRQINCFKANRLRSARQSPAWSPSGQMLFLQGMLD